MRKKLCGILNLSLLFVSLNVTASGVTETQIDQAFTKIRAFSERTSFSFQEEDFAWVKQTVLNDFVVDWCKLNMTSGVLPCCGVDPDHIWARSILMGHCCREMGIEKPEAYRVGFQAEAEKQSKMTCEDADALLRAEPRSAREIMEVKIRGALENIKLTSAYDFTIQEIMWANYVILENFRPDWSVFDLRGYPGVDPDRVKHHRYLIDKYCEGRVIPPILLFNYNQAFSTELQQQQRVSLQRQDQPHFSLLKGELFIHNGVQSLDLIHNIQKSE